MTPVGDGTVSQSEVLRRSHRLVLVNWSRYTWSTFRLTWFMGLPFSLANIAGYMAVPEVLEPRSPGLSTVRRRLSRVLPHVFGLALTACAVPWIAACLEAFFRHWASPTAADPVLWGRWPVVAGAIAMITPMAWRAWRRAPGEDSVAWGLVVLHSAVVIAVGWFLVAGDWIRAARAPDGWSVLGVLDVSGWVASCTPGPPAVAAASAACFSAVSGAHAMASADPLALVVGAAFLLLVVISVVAVVLKLLPHELRSHRVAMSGALAAGWAGFAVLNSVFGLLVLGLDWAPLYLQSRFSWLAGLRNAPLDDCTTVTPAEGMSACVRSVYPYEPAPSAPWFHLTFVPSVLFLVVLVTLLLAIYGRPKTVVEGIGIRGRLQRRAHATVVALGARPAGAALAIVVVASAVTVFAWLRIVDGRYTVWDGVASIVAHAGALVGVLWLVSGGRVPRLKALGYVGDLVGFWPVRFHPLAGSSYRQAVARGIDAVLNEAKGEGGPVVLVGHSQGSVMAAWVTHMRGQAPQHGLVTCGSPLSALYGAFFPEHFSHAWFREAKDHARGWVNLWRDTDPISAPIDVLGEESNEQIPDVQEPVNSHANYWEDPTQVGVVARLLTHEGPAARVIGAE